jgi:hypothetical protein
MFRSQARLDYAFPLAIGLLALSFSPGTADAGRFISDPSAELGWSTPACQATVPTGSSNNATQPATDESDDSDFFSWIKKMVEPTTRGGQPKPAASTRPRPERDNGGHRDGGRGGGGGGQSH